jgi:hypothetical protein
VKKSARKTNQWGYQPADGLFLIFTALKFSPNCPHSIANFALSKTKFGAIPHKRPRCNNPHILGSLIQ